MSHRKRLAVALAFVLLKVADGTGASAGSLTDEQRQEIHDAIAQNVARLEAKGVLSPPFETSVLFDWPLRPAAGVADPGVDYVSSHVDHAPQLPDWLLDYNCGDRTYDSVTLGNHRGTDIIVWPFPWLKMDNDEVEIVSAAAGTIVFKQDGYFDRSCSCLGGAWNAVYVRHADGSTVWYGHMKNGSTTSKGVGATVAAGEFLGVVGSSGCSTIPHLHMEVYDASNNLIDPYEGPCNGLNPDSRWLDQHPYDDSAVNRIVIGDKAPTSPDCGQPEQTNETYAFVSNEWVHLSVYLRNVVEGQRVDYRVLRPDGSEQYSWSEDLTFSITALSLHYTRFLPLAADEGIWLFTVTYEGTVHERTFSVNRVAGAGRMSPTLSLGKPTIDGLPMTWGDSCNPDDTTYGVYVGHIGYWGIHGPSACDLTEKSYSVPLNHVAGDRYYLVVPSQEDFEGSCGLDSTGAERPRGPVQCRFVQFAECP